MRGKGAFYPIIAFFLLSCGLISCGIDENFFLPQVPQNNIQKTFNTGATITFPSIDSYYYADSYTIYYRIYISESDPGASIQLSDEVLRGINSQLASDYRTIYPSTDPVNTTTTDSAENLFRVRGYFELELDVSDLRSRMSKSGGRLEIIFPTATGTSPTLVLNGGTSYRLYRSRNLISPEPDLLFINSVELSDSAKAITNINADVQRISTGSPAHAYVNMYIVAVGNNPSNFTRIYSKPTHINIFKLPN